MTGLLSTAAMLFPAALLAAPAGPGAAPPAEQSGFGFLGLVTAVLFALGYMVSLYIHPYRKCSSCGGSGKHSGTMFTHSFRTCRTCNGSSRQPRLGARVFGVLKDK